MSYPERVAWRLVFVGALFGAGVVTLPTMIICGTDGLDRLYDFLTPIAEKADLA
jgi:hypothetical protein